MKVASKFVLGLCLLGMPFLLSAQDVFKEYEHLFLPPQNYVVFQTSDSILVDGKPDEKDWQKAKWTADFVDIEGDRKPAPLYPTRVKMLWNKHSLYILAEIIEPHIWSYYTSRDQIVYQENDFEMFIDPDWDAQNYFEFEVNAANTLFDLFMPRPYRTGGIPMISWDSTGFRSAVSVDGTLNNPTDEDWKWTLEMAIPFHDLRLGVWNQIPKDGQTWKMNFSRVNWQTRLVDGKYTRKTDAKTGRMLSEYNWVWSPTGEINMHVPERWGLIQFSEEKVQDGKAVFRMPPEEEWTKYLWCIFYKQRDFMQTEHRFASSLSELGVPEQIKLESGVEITLKMESTETQFSVLLTQSDMQWTLNELGLLQRRTIKKQ